MTVKEQWTVELEVPQQAEEVLRMMGCAAGGTLRPEIREVVDRLMAETAEMIHPRGVYTIRPVARMTDTQLDLADSPSIWGPIAGFLKPAKRVAVFVVTIGDAVERLATERMSASKTLEGYILHAIGSAAADAAADAITDHVLWNEASPDEAVAPPFSPGYCGLPLDQQQPLFSMVNAGVIGVRLTPSMIMVPIKSISGLVGIGDASEVTEHGVPCQWCDLDDCKMRRPGR